MDDGDPELAFGYMVNYLEACGRSDKEDRICGLADFCSSMAGVVLAGGAVRAVATFGQTRFPLTGEALRAALVEVFGVGALFLACMALCLRYERMRFSTVVRTYAALRRCQEREARA